MRLIYLAMICLWMGCGHPELELKTADLTEIPDSFTYTGDPVDIRTWDDLNGKNILLMTRENKMNGDTALSRYLTIYHCLIEADTARLLRKAWRSEERCTRINQAGFSKDIFLTDIDHNGLGEVMLAHYGGCTDGDKPLPIRMVMFEDGDIYIIRGTTRLASGEGGRKRVEWSYFFGPPEFLTYANQQWRHFERLSDDSILQ